MFNTKYHQHLQRMHNDLERSQIQHEINTSRYDNPEPVPIRLSLSEKIAHMSHQNNSHVHTPIIPAASVNPINKLKVKLLEGSGSSQVPYKRQSTVIGGGNVDYK